MSEPRWGVSALRYLALSVTRSIVIVWPLVAAGWVAAGVPGRQIASLGCAWIGLVALWVALWQDEPGWSK